VRLNDCPGRPSNHLEERFRWEGGREEVVDEREEKRRKKGRRRGAEIA